MNGKHSKYYLSVKHIGHPRTNKAGRIMVHRLVVERFLRRFLSPEEIVHHINGVMDDNRINNLMVFKNASYHQKAETKNLPYKNKRYFRGVVFDGGKISRRRIKSYYETFGREIFY